MLKARHNVGKAIGIQVSSNVFSSFGGMLYVNTVNLKVFHLLSFKAQKAARACGFSESWVAKYSDLPTLDPSLTTDGFYPNIKDEYIKIMSKKLY